MSSPEPLPMGIELSHVAKSYGSVQAVRGIDLAVAPGETVALLGPNGAGMTTTIDMILGLSQPDSGTVSVFGASPREAVKSGWVGGTLQDGSPPDQLRVRELVTLVASYYPHPLPVDDVLRQTGTDCPNTLGGGEGARSRSQIVKSNLSWAVSVFPCW